MHFNGRKKSDISEFPYTLMYRAVCDAQSNLIKSGCILHSKLTRMSWFLNKLDAELI